MSYYSDGYDEQIAYLTENPHMIQRHWMDRLGCFQIASKNNKPQDEKGIIRFGCLSMIRNNVRDYEAEVERFTEEIRNDFRLPRIPSMITNIRIEHLPIFAEWQRKIDKELNRIPQFTKKTP